MIRRKLALYTSGYIFGITALYLIIERGEETAVISMVLLILYVLFCGIKKEYLMTRTAQIILLFMISGAGIYGLAYMKYDISGINAEGITSIAGTVVNVQSSDESVLFEIQRNSINRGEKVLCKYYGNDKLGYELIGRKLKLYGKLKIPESQRNPGCFNYRLYLRSKEIKYLFTVKNYRILKVTDKPVLSLQLKKVMMYKKKAFEDNFKDDEQVYGFIRGVVFGDKSCLDESVYEEFLENSTAHVLAVSGLHIGFIFAVMRILMKSRKTIAVSIGIIVVLLLYGVMTSWNISTVRSVIIITAGMISFYVRRPYDLLSGLSITALVMLTYNPYYLFSSGFHMSFLAILGICFFTKPISYFTGEAFAVLLAIQLVMIPYSAFMFNKITFAGLLVNIPVVMIVSIIVPLAVIELAVGSVTGIFPGHMTYAVKALSEMTVRLNHLLNFNGEFSNDVVSHNIYLMLFIYAALLFISSEYFKIMILRKEYKRILKGAAALFLCVLFLGYGMRNKFLNDDIVFIDVGQGDAVHLRDGNIDVTFDGGGNMNYNIGENILKPYMLKNNARDIDLSFLTHLHMDHYKGITELNQSYPIENIAMPASYRQILGKITSEDGISEKQLHFMKIGDKITIKKGITVEIIWPKNSEIEDIENADENELNMVMKIDYRGTKILITGDLLEEGEHDMIKYYRGTDKLDCDILKVCHHGSKSSSSDEFLDAVSPEIAVIQVGANNTYGHPGDKTIKKLKKRNIKIYRNDRDGAVGMEIGKNKIKVERMVKDNVI